MGHAKGQPVMRRIGGREGRHLAEDEAVRPDFSGAVDDGKEDHGRL